MRNASPTNFNYTNYIFGEWLISTFEYLISVRYGMIVFDRVFLKKLIAIINLKDIIFSVEKIARKEFQNSCFQYIRISNRTNV